MASLSEGSSSKRRFPCVIVSRSAYEIIQDLEAAWCRFNAATNAEAIGNAYAELCQRRKELYEQIEKLETGLLDAHADVVILRFT